MFANCSYHLLDSLVPPSVDEDILTKKYLTSLQYKCSLAIVMNPRNASILHNTPAHLHKVLWTEIVDMLPESGILLLDSETGGGKTTIIQYSNNDWSVDGNEMKSISNYDYIFRMILRNSHLQSVGDLI